MRKNTANENLNDAIVLLQEKQSAELQLLKQQFQITYQSLKPINLIKSTFNELTRLPELNEKLTNTTASIIVGYLSKKIFQSAATNPLKIIVSNILMIGTNKLFEKNPYADKAFSKGIFSIINHLKAKYIQHTE